MLHDVVHALGIPAPLLVGDDQVGVRPEVEGASADEALAHRLLQEGHVERLDRGDLVGVLLDQVGQAVQHRRSFPDGEGTPLLEATLRRGDGGAGRLVVTAGDLGERAVVPTQRRASLERLVRSDPRPTDQMIDGHRDATDVGPPAGSDHESSSTVLS